jgi:hypothetical protein
MCVCIAQRGTKGGVGSEGGGGEGEVKWEVGGWLEWGRVKWEGRVACVCAYVRVSM